MSLHIYIVKYKTETKKTKDCFVFEPINKVLGEYNLIEIPDRRFIQLYPNSARVKEIQVLETEYLYESNITHNLGRMADKAGIYKTIWRPYRLHKDYVGFKDDYKAEMEFEDKVDVIARDLIKPIEVGLELLREKPNYFKTFNPSNGWGSYDGFVDFASKYLQALKDNPDGLILCSR